MAVCPLSFPQTLQRGRDMIVVRVYNLGYMAQEINLGGTIYISSKRAAEMTGYTQDYIGQLARGGQIIAQRVSGLWYVVEESLRNYKSKADEFKPTPPPVVKAQSQMESSVSFDGRDYVSTQRAAEITGYHPDYVSQLARNGKVLSRQVGSRWFVAREEVVEHKRHNDALLAAVQAESVGLMKQVEPLPEKMEEGLHFNYVAEEGVTSPYLPAIDQKSPAEREADAYEDDAPQAAEEVNEIPIRVIRPITEARMPKPEAQFERSATRHRPSRLLNAVISATVVGAFVVGVGYLYLFNRSALVTGYAVATSTIQAAATYIPVEALAERLQLPGFISNELYYRRDSF